MNSVSLQSETRNALRAGLRRFTESRRERQCGICPVDAKGATVNATGRPGQWKASWCSVLMCGHIHTCAVCSHSKRSERLDRLVRAMGNAGGTWVMVTLTVRHRAGTPLRLSRQGVASAWRRCRQGGSTQRIWRENVSASARATEITHGKNGWHVHLHVLLRSDEWNDEDRAALLGRWQAAVVAELGAEAMPDAEHGVRWSTPINACSSDDAQRAAYLVKLGAEVVGGETKSRAKKQSRTTWQILADAIGGDASSRALWLEYAEATKGSRAIELDDRCNKFAKAADLAAPLGVDVATPLEDGGNEQVTIRIAASELRDLRAYEQRFDPTVLAAMLNDVRGSARPEPVVRCWLTLVREKLARSGLWYEGDEPPWYSRNFGRGPPHEGPHLSHDGRPNHSRDQRGGADSAAGTSGRSGRWELVGSGSVLGAAGAG